MDKTLIINEIMKVYNFRKYGDFADFLGVKQQIISNWNKRNSFDVDLIYSKCEKISANYILSGEGEILRTGENLPKGDPELHLEIERLKEENSELKSKLIACYEKAGVNGGDPKSKSS